MIKWDKQKYNEYGVLQVSDKDIEIFAYSQLKDYKKDYFKTVQPLDIEDFIENYLKQTIRYYKLSPNKSRFGMTAISNGYVPIIDDDGNPDLRNFEKGTICIDLDACNNNEGLIRFSLGHETGHTQFDMHVNNELLDGNTYVNEEKKFDEYGFFKNKTQKDLMEYHANKYASYLLMPSTFVRKLYKQKYDEIMPGQRLGTRQRKLIWKMIYEMANVLKVSQTAMAWRLLSLNILSQELFDVLGIYTREN